MISYFWTVVSDDKRFFDKSEKIFSFKEDCYNDMRNSALKKMKWNTEFSADFGDDGDIIGYDVKFSKNKIVHTSYSGTYTYNVHEVVFLDRAYGVSLFAEGKDKLLLVFDDRGVADLYMCFDHETDAYPLDVIGALSYQWHSEHYKGDYMLIPIEGGKKVSPILLEDNTLDRLAALNGKYCFDGICLVEQSRRGIKAISISDVRILGLEETFADGQKYFEYENAKEINPLPRTIDMFGKSWERVDKVPYRDSIWEVLDMPDWLVQMDNDYGEMYLTDKKTKRIYRYEL